MSKPVARFTRTLLSGVALAVAGATAAQPAGGGARPADEYLDACRPYVRSEVDEDAVRLGMPDGLAEVELDALPTHERKGMRTEVAGGGRFRLGPGYDWLPLTWTCRYDEKDGEVDRARYKGDARAAIATLPPERRQALDRCRRAVGALVGGQASRARWESSRYTVSPGLAGAFGEQDGRPVVEGTGEVTLRVGSTTSVGMRYTCTFDPDVVDGAIEAAVVLAPSPYTADGQLVENRYDTITCSSTNFEEQRCSTSRPIAGNVRVKFQYSKTSCQGRFRWETWAIYVRDGCRAEFEFETR